MKFADYYAAKITDIISSVLFVCLLLKGAMYPYKKARYKPKCITKAVKSFWPSPPTTPSLISYTTFTCMHKCINSMLRSILPKAALILKVHKEKESFTRYTLIYI